MSEPSCFIDSNIWLYRLLVEPDDPNHTDQRKRPIAIGLTSAEDINISSQVINEVCVVLVKKAKFAENQIKQVIQELYDGCIVTELNRDILLNASHIRSQYCLSFWDSLIVASALTANASILYSEDMQDGLVVDQRLRIVNPFISQD